jgi:excisionase family DNA binding protein
MESALFKHSRGVPTYTVPEAAELLSISPEALYRLVRGEVFPAVRVGQKYSVPAAAVADLLTDTVRSGQCIDIAEWGPAWMEQHRRSPQAPTRTGPVLPSLSNEFERSTA